MTDFTYSVDAEGVATITWDVVGKSMNVMSLAGFARTGARSPDRLPNWELTPFIVQGSGGRVSGRGSREQRKARQRAN